MSGSTTPNYGFGLPTIGGNQDSWGNVLNSNWSSLDTLLHDFVASGSGFLPTTGGTISGNLTVIGTSQFNGTLGANGLVAFNFPTVNDFYMIRTGGNRQLHWSASASLNWSESDGAVRAVYGGAVTLTSSANGDFSIGGANAYKTGGSSAWTVVSDDRVKRRVEPYVTGLDAICNLEPISFEYNGQGGTGRLADGTRYTGLSARATQPVMPEMVTKMPTTDTSLLDLLGIDYGPLTLALCNAVRELRDRVVALEAESA